MIKESLSSIDLFGTPIAVSFSGREKYRSRFGGTCSILFLAFVLWEIYNASQDLVLTRNPKITTSETYTDNPKALTLTRNNFPVAFGLQAPDTRNYQLFKNESIYTFTLFQAIFNRTRYENGTIDEQINIVNVPMENCTSGHFGELASSFETLEFDDLYCIARDNHSEYQEITIVGVGESLYYRGFSLQVAQCNNITSGGKCATQQVIDSYLAGSWLNVYYGNMVVDGQNYSRPDSRYRDRYYTMIHPSNYVYATVYLGRVEVSTDSNWLTSNPIPEEYIQVNDINDYIQFASRSDRILMHVNFETSKLEKSYARSYKKIQNVLAEVAGLANTLLIAVFLVTAPYSKLKFRESLINELFDFKDKKNPGNRKKKPGKKKMKNNLNMVKLNSAESVQSEPQIITKPDKKELYIQTNFPTSGDGLETLHLRFESPLGIREKNLRINIAEDMSSKKDSFISSPRNAQNSLLIEPSPKNVRSSSQRKQEHKRLSYFNKFSRVRRSSRLAASLPATQYKSKKNTQNLPVSHEGFKSGDGQFDPMKGVFSSKRDSIKLESKPLRDLEDENLKDANEQVGEDEEGFNIKHTTERNLLTEEKMTHISKNNRIFLQDHRNNASPLVKSYEDMNENQDKRPNNEEEQELDHRIFINEKSQEPEKINLSVWEYICSFVYRPPTLKRKMKILSEGVKNINDRLDILNLLKKIREIDKLKALLLDPDQLMLFNLLPKPKLRPEKDDEISRFSTFSLQQLRQPKFIEESKKEESTRDAYQRVRNKIDKTEIDRKLLETIHVAVDTHF